MNSSNQESLPCIQETLPCAGGNTMYTLHVHSHMLTTFPLIFIMNNTWFYDYTVNTHMYGNVYTCTSAGIICVHQSIGKYISSKSYIG